MLKGGGLGVKSEKKCFFTHRACFAQGMQNVILHIYFIYYSKNFLTWLWPAFHKCITNITSWAATNSSMQDHITVGISTAGTRAWIQTFVVDTSFISRAFIVDDTLWTTCNVRVSLKLWWTCAFSSVIDICTNSISSTGCW